MRMIALMVCLVSIAATAMEQTVQELPFLTTDIYVNIIDQLMPERRFGNSEEIKSFGKIWKVWSCVNKSLNKYLSQEDTRLDVMQKLGKEGQLNIWTAEVIGFKEIKTHLEYLYNTAQRTPLLLKTEDIRHSFYANLDHLLYHYINSGILEVIERFLAC